MHLRLATRRLLLVLTTLAVVPSAFAQVSVKVLEKNQTLSGWSTQHKWDWATNSEGVRQLTSRILLTPPSSFGLKAAKGASDATKLKVVNGKLIMKIDGLKERFAVGGAGGKKTLTVALDPSQASVFLDENCAKQFVKLELKSKAPFYVGTSCTTQGDKLVFSLSLPREVTISKTNLFETKGKGESYRSYEVGNIKAASGSIGEFTFRMGNTDVPASLVSLRNESGQNKKLNAGKIGVGLTYNMLSAEATAASATDSKPGLKLKIPSFPVFWKIGLGLDFETAFSLGSAAPGSKSINYTQTQLFAQISVVDSDRFNLSPRGYFVISNHQETLSKASLSHSNIGIGAHATYAVTDRLLANFEFLMSNFGSKAVKSHMAIEANVILKKATEEGFSYGGGAKMQNYGAQSAAGADSKFGQNIVYGIILF